MATVASTSHINVAGGSFLIEERKPAEIFTPEDFTEQHLLIAQTAEEFANKEISPHIEKLEGKDLPLLRSLVRKAGELGLSGADVPEQYGGMQMDKVTSAIIADRIAKYGGAKLPCARPAFGGRQTLSSERREDVDHKCRICGPVHRIRKGGWGKVHGFHRGAEIPGLLRGRRRAQDGNPRFVNLSTDP